MTITCLRIEWCWALVVSAAVGFAACSSSSTVRDGAQTGGGSGGRPSASSGGSAAGIDAAVTSSGGSTASSAGGASSSNGGTANTGGVSTGGVSQSGGSTASGGVSTGSTDATAGTTTTTGGTPAAGGTANIGGSLSSAGSKATGGSAGAGGATTGGTRTTGGTTATGGTAISAGTTAATGGTTTGGTSATGGTTAATGGTRTTGGTTAGGNTTAPTSLGAIYSGVPWLDTDGNLVNAHGVGFIKVGSTYYMVGEQRSGSNDTYSGAPINAEDSFTGVSMYSTTDFVNWTFVGTVVKPIPGTIVAPPYYGERPKILYNSSTSKYIIYIKMLQYTGSRPIYTGSYAVLTSSNISGPYTFVKDLGLGGANDFEVFQDTDGSQYLARDGGWLYKFSADGLSTQQVNSTSIQVGEGTSLYKAGSTYFWQSSQGSYWYSNDNSYSTATSLTGPWTAHGYFCPSGSKTWQSQDTAVVTVAGSSGTTYIYVGDRWVNGDLPASTLVVQPFTVSGSTESISTYNPVWSLDVGAGTWSPVTPSGTSVNDNTTGTGPNQFNYSSGWTAAACSGCNGGDAHYSSTADATASIAFNGTQILLYSAYNTSSGIMGVTLCDGSGTALNPELHVSLRYDAPATGNYLVYASPVMSRGAYVLKVRVTGKKDLYSSGTSCNVDRVLILGGS